MYLLQCSMDFEDLQLQGHVRDVNFAVHWSLPLVDFFLQNLQKLSFKLISI